MKTTSPKNGVLTQQLIQNLHLTDAGRLIAIYLPDIGRDSIRHRVDAAHAAVGRAGRFRHAHWGVISILVALGFVAGADLAVEVGGAFLHSVKDALIAEAASILEEAIKWGYIAGKLEGTSNNDGIRA